MNYNLGGVVIAGSQSWDVILDALLLNEDRAAAGAQISATIPSPTAGQPPVPNPEYVYIRPHVKNAFRSAMDYHVGGYWHIGQTYTRQQHWKDWHVPTHDTEHDGRPAAADQLWRLCGSKVLMLELTESCLCFKPEQVTADDFNADGDYSSDKRVILRGRVREDLLRHLWAALADVAEINPPRGPYAGWVRPDYLPRRNLKQNVALALSAEEVRAGTNFPGDNGYTSTLHNEALIVGYDADPTYPALNTWSGTNLNPLILPNMHRDAAANYHPGYARCIVGRRICMPLSMGDALTVKPCTSTNVIAMLASYLPKHVERGLIGRNAYKYSYR